MKKSIFLFSIFLTFLVSCSDHVELTQEKAMNILKDNFRETCEKRLIYTTTDRDKDYKWIMDKAQQLARMDLIETESRFYRGFGGGGHTKFHFKPTQTLNEEFKEGNSYTIAESKINEILGIALDKETKTARVRFSYSLEPNILYDFRGYINARRETCPMEVKEAEEEFILYDTGWQLKK